MGKHLTEVSLSRLPYLPQTVCKGAKKQERERHREREREEGTATGQKATGLFGRVRLTVLRGSHKAHSWRTHLDQENQSWLTFLLLPLSSDLSLQARYCSLTISCYLDQCN